MKPQKNSIVHLLNYEGTENKEAQVVDVFYHGIMVTNTNFKGFGSLTRKFIPNGEYRVVRK